MIFEFNMNEDYHEQFGEFVNLIVIAAEQPNRPSTDDRIRIVSDLLDDYVEQTGERPPVIYLGALARVIDIDYYKSKDTRIDKGLEYNYHTETQEIRRKRRELGDHIVEYYDTEGVNTTLPTRCNRRKEKELLGDDSLSRSVPPPFTPTRVYGKTITYTV